MPGRGSRTAPLRPAGPARGAWAFAAAWVVGVAIALLTGASSVVILLMAGLVAMAAGFVAAPLRLRRAGVVGVELPAVATTGEPLTAVVEVTGRWPVHVEVRVAPARLGGSRHPCGIAADDDQSLAHVAASRSMIRPG